MSRLSLMMLTSLLAVFTFGGTPQQEKTSHVRFSHPDIISYDHDGFIIHGKHIFIYSGSFHYFRCDSSEWRDRLEKIKAAGFNAIETYVPWNWHEQNEGQPDFAPLERFLNECQQDSLYVIVRPGPYICAEWNIGGFPDWLEGKHIGFRTASPADIHWSKYWYDEVLPVIRRHLITNGGSIILMQIENEYDYFGLPDSDKVTYLKSLYETAMKNGIDVPIITCWTRQARDNSDSVFSQVMDACNFYPGWTIESTLPRIASMEKEEPDSPPMITELQGGWFSNVGDKSIRRVNDFGPDQIIALTDYVIAHGIKALNYYMLYGGTNFGYWGAKDKTTSYDYTAPISEPGGLWEKYRAVKLIGDFIRLEGSHLVHSREVRNGAESETPGVEAVLQTDGSTGFLFVWNKNDRSVGAKVRFRDPHGSPVTLTVPMRARGACLLPVGVPLPGGATLYYSNVPVSAIAQHNGKPLIVAYGNPGDEATIYAGSSLCTEEIKDVDQLFNWDGVYVLLTTEDRAARSRVFDTPSGPVALVSDSYLTLDKGIDGKVINVSLQTRPGSNSFSLLAGDKVASVSIDGKAVKTNVERRTGLIIFSLSTSPIKLPNIQIKDLHVKADAEAPPPGSWMKLQTAGDSLVPLDTQGNYASGYTVYSGAFSTDQSGLLKLDYYDNDWHLVLIDGKAVAGLTGSGEQDISKDRLPAGKHTIEIVYENEGWPNGGFMEQNKGLKSISFLQDGQIETLDNWKHSPTAAPYPGPNPPEALPSFNDTRWAETTVGNGNQPFIRENEGWWFRAHLELSEDAVRQNATLTFKAIDDNALIYLNGKLAADHHGYDTPITVQLAQLGNPGDNVIAVYVQNQGAGGGIWKPVVFKWGSGVPLTTDMRFHHSLAGKLADWQSGAFDDSGWKTSKGWESVQSPDKITWYRVEFTVPTRAGWIVPWRLHIESTGSGQIWINGKLLGRFFSTGPQKDFYLPDAWLNMKGKNSIVFMMRPGGDGSKPPVISEVYIAPYDEYVVQKHTLKITLK